MLWHVDDNSRGHNVNLQASLSSNMSEESRSVVSNVIELINERNHLQRTVKTIGELVKLATK